MPKRTSAAHPSPWARARGRSNNSTDKRNAVLSTAAELFNERGYHATSLDAIAARLQVTKPTLYYYFRSKDDILMQCVRRGLEKMQDEIEAARAGGGNSLMQLRACMRSYAEICTEPFGMCLIRVGDQDVPAAGRARIRAVKAEIDRAFRNLIAQGVEDGLLKGCDPKITAFAVAGALSWIARWYQPEGDLPPEAIINQTVATLLGGLLAEGDGRQPG